MSGKFCNRYLGLGFSAIEEKEMWKLQEKLMTFNKRANDLVMADHIHLLGQTFGIGKHGVVCLTT